MLHNLLSAFEETLFMVIASGLLTLLLGLPLGILLAVTHPKQLFENAWLHKSLDLLIQATHSIPYVILMVALIPFSRWLMGTEEGCLAAILPLTLATIPFFAKLCEQAIHDIPQGLVDTVQAMGGTPFQIIRYVFLPEAQPKIIRGLTVTLTHLVGYSTIAGALGSGGLGNLAIDKGYHYHVFQADYVFATVIVLVIMVQAIQKIGEYIAQVNLR